jgi:hypothetical protein
MHTAWRPLVYTDSITPKLPYSWLKRKFFCEHLLNVQEKGFNIYGDIAIDEYIGYGSRDIHTSNAGYVSTPPMMNTRGYEAFGNVGSKFYFETDFYENQGRFPGYVDSIIRKAGVIPGQAAYKNVGDGKGFDFNYSTARLIYLPNKHLSFDLGYGKNFLGDGYRSLMLSDFSLNHPYFKATANFGKFQYTALWSQYISEKKADIYAYGFPRKWSQTFFLDWKATKNFSIGLFESVMWPGQDSNHTKDVSPWLASPLIFVHGKQTPAGQDNNEMVGLNLKYKVLPRTFAYSQLVVDQFGNSSSWENRYAFQLGVRSNDIFNVHGLNALLEFNTARPYMYAGTSADVNYQHFNQALAHPLGANFKELLLLTNYQYKHWWFRLETYGAKQGADPNYASNYGSNILKSIDTRSVSDNVKTGQGVSTNLYFVDFRMAYIINPATNLRIEAGVTLRDEKSSLFHYQDKVFTIGIRTTFRNLFYDF